MKKKLILLLVSVLALTVVVAASGLVFYLLDFNQSATVAPVGTVTVTINGQIWTNETTIPWGTVNVGANTLPITITSYVNAALTPSISGAPTDWTIALSLDNSPIDPFGTATGTIVLTVPANAAAQSYNWQSTLKVES